MYAVPNTTDRNTSLLSVADMQFALERERSRSERTDAPFVLIVLRWEEAPQAERIERLLAAYLGRRLRLTDEAGWLSGNQLAILLSDTPEQGAETVAADVCQQLPESLSAQCEVFVYPDVPDATKQTQPARTSKSPRPVYDARQLYQRPLPTWKRAVDVVLGSLMLLAAAPILLVAALVIKVTSRGPILFTQKRAGLNGKPFTIFKLRTMVTDAESQKAALRSISEQDGPAFKLRNDPRVTPIGRFLRKSCIDELPQLLNVLRGEMSIVGPRPLPIDEAAKCKTWEQRRLDVTPGLTCIWQVRGALKVSFAEWMRMDIRYIRRRNLVSDFKLIMQTAFAVIAHRASC